MAPTPAGRVAASGSIWPGAGGAFAQSAMRRYEPAVIISLHIPKSGGQSFRARLQATFGARLLLDYGDWEELNAPEIVARRAHRIAEARARADDMAHDYDIIHGHFKADKYKGLFREARFGAIFRDPYQQTVSHYQFFLRHPEIDHPAVRAFHARKMDLADFAASLPNIQSLYLGTLSVDDLSMVGLTEAYDRSVKLFETVFGRTLARAPRENVNPYRTEEAYAIDAATRAVVERHRAADLAVYSLAQARFERLCSAYDV